MPRAITEIVGPPGVGKTQFSMMVSVLAIRQAASRSKGEPYGVIYIDTEAGFRPDRVDQIAGILFPSRMDSIGNHLHYFQVSSSSELMTVLEQLEALIIEAGVNLVVLDSAAALVRKEYGRETIVQRQRLLARQAALLKRLADIFSIPVVVTNQMVMSRHAIPLRSANGEDSDHEHVLSAALGNTWAHCVNTRLELQRDSRGNRRICIAKSPISPPDSFPVELTQGGLVQQSDM